MNTSTLVPLLVAGMLASGAGLAQTAAAQAPSPATKAGLWETTTVIEDASTNSRRSIVARTCVGAADVSNLARIVPAQREFGMQCENLDLKREGTSVAWNISCKSGSATQTGKGKMSLFADSYLGTADLELRKQGSKPLKLTQSFSGRWLQACS
jgi:hypothetical protein